MRRIAPILICAAVLAPSAAHAAVVPVSTVRGTLANRTGATMMSMRPSGISKSVKLTAAGAFSFRMPTSELRDATLQLVDKSGRYGGPIVLRTVPGRAYTRLSGVSVDLGVLQMRSGYARVTRVLPNGAINLLKFARTDALGKPVGASKLGLVKATVAPRLSTTRSLAAATVAPVGTGSGDDPDGDGVPSGFDADDNGNGSLDSTDPASAKSAGSDAGLFSTLYLSLQNTINANVGAVTQAQIDAVFAGENNFGLNYYFDSGRFRGQTVTSVDVDCFGAIYCARGTGTGVISGMSESGPSLPRGDRWATYSPNRSGLPNLENMRPGVWAMGMQPRVPMASIHPGDTYNVNFRMAGGAVVTVPTSLSAYFVTVPALQSWSDGTTTTTMSYPVTDSSAGVLSAPTGSVGMTFWRPQRAAIAGAGETGNFVDMGKLHYGVTTSLPGVPGEIGCGGYFSGLSSTFANDYVAGTSDFNKKLMPLRDTGADAAPNPASTLSFTLDLAGCIRAAGGDPTGREIMVTLTAASESRQGGMDRAAQSFLVQL